MAVHHSTAEADSSGIVRLAVPVGGSGTFDVQVRVLPTVDAKTLASAEERGWPPDFFERFYGCIDDETFIAPA